MVFPRSSIEVISKQHLIYANLQSSLQFSPKLQKHTNQENFYLD
uniref:Uncharacterized protein n=1 Tax=Arundo donax TaxID=35708 RepID=A0A0A9A031_ARUDO